MLIIYYHINICIKIYIEKYFAFNLSYVLTYFKKIFFNKIFIFILYFIMFVGYFYDDAYMGLSFFVHFLFIFILEIFYKQENIYGN